MKKFHCLAGAAVVPALRNLRAMHLLERIARKFNEAAVPLLVLKGAALNLALYDRPDQRPMDDLDIMIRPEEVDAARAILEELGGLRGEPQVREDFFPRFHYETEYRFGRVHPVKIDLHVRPFRPLRYAATVPAEAFWERAGSFSIGRATVLLPSIEDMLIHLAVHLAIHGRPQPKWLMDIKSWADAHHARIEWEEVLTTVDHWSLALPFRTGIEWVEREYGPVCPPQASARLLGMSVGWGDRLALRQAPRDAEHPVAHITVSVLSTPGLSFTLSYLLASLVPDKAHMADWYCRRHLFWLPCAHLLRWLAPILGRLSRGAGPWAKVELRPSPIHGVGVFAIRPLKSGEVAARYYGKRVDQQGMYVIAQQDASGKTSWFELTGKLKFLNHSCHPNAKLYGFRLMALRPIADGEEITIDYGPGTCDCR